jgi:hypothetical protein
LRMLQSCLQELLTKNEEASLHLLVPPVLLERLLHHKCFQNLPLLDETHVTAHRSLTHGTNTALWTRMIPESLQPLSTALQARFQALLPTSIQTLLNRLRHYCHYATTMLLPVIIDTPKDDNHAQAIQQQQQFRRHVALLLASILLTWRHRQRVGQWGKALLTVLLAPVMEVVDALRTMPPDEDA